MTESQLFTYILPALAITLTLFSTIHLYVEKPSEVKDKLKRTKLESLERIAKTHTSISNHILSQVDVAQPLRNWRGDGSTESDYMYEFSKANLDITIKILKIEKLKGRTDAYSISSFVIITATIACTLISIATNNLTLAKITSTASLTSSLALFILYLKHCNTVSELE
ncbi:hypothetical protein VNPA152081_61380 [Pseudomonas aeruginosa]|uniref:hypothetical protein n=1 Tax=Pseudomonas aeruginosa TaxID=287 RepID=UPI000FC40321|nr:hypothetical protein [Pseudomonas aeruginosa]EJB8386523.1 hypothetical protein [Pseudomonas aeruginosa]MBN7870211.1 hypothetical protein [Pseudomonas aeruginosa]RUB25661.1 hypothetical protein IPC1432_27085 [Pseudomonas aeruginosa]GLF61791.1 hypothetical protein VNPA141826_59550 [Pseudomonas aeruginosa]GLF81062.1 hypothetical protein VNPA152081_61380 [Pseudomonas aeruginosa]